MPTLAVHFTLLFIFEQRPTSSLLASAIRAAIPVGSVPCGKLRLRWNGEEVAEDPDMRGVLGHDGAALLRSATAKVLSSSSSLSGESDLLSCVSVTPSSGSEERLAVGEGERWVHKGGEERDR